MQSGRAAGAREELAGACTASVSAIESRDHGQPCTQAQAATSLSMDLLGSQMLHNCCHDWRLSEVVKSRVSHGGDEGVQLAGCGSVHRGGLQADHCLVGRDHSPLVAGGSHQRIVHVLVAVQRKVHRASGGCTGRSVVGVSLADLSAHMQHRQIGCGSVTCRPVGLCAAGAEASRSAPRLVQGMLHAVWSRYAGGVGRPAAQDVRLPETSMCRHTCRCGAAAVCSVTSFVKVCKGAVVEPQPVVGAVGGRPQPVACSRAQAVHLQHSLAEKGNMKAVPEQVVNVSDSADPSVAGKAVHSLSWHKLGPCIRTEMLSGLPACQYAGAASGSWPAGPA